MKVKVIAWMSVYAARFDCLLFTNGQLLKAMGPHQREEATPSQTTIGALRQQWGDDSVALGMPDDTPAWEYHYGQEEEGFTFVIAEVNLQ